MLIENTLTGEIATLKPGQHSITFSNDEKAPSSEIPAINFDFLKLELKKTVPINEQMADLLKELHIVKKISVRDYEEVLDTYLDRE